MIIPEMTRNANVRLNCHCSVTQ